MFVEFILWVIALFILCIVLYARWNYGVLESLGIPVVDRSFMFGSTPYVHEITQHEEDIARFKKYGPVFGVYEGRLPIVYICDPDLVKQIFVKDFSHFINRRTVNFGDDLLNETIDFLPYDKWKVVRSSISPAFTMAKVRRLKDHVHDCLEEFLSSLKAQCGKTGETKADIRNVILPYTTSMTARAFYGLKVDKPEDENNFFRKAMAEMLGENEEHNFMYTLVSTFPFLAKFAPTVFSEASNEFMKMVLAAIAERERQKVSDRSSKNDFLDHLASMLDQVNTPEYKRLGITRNTIMAQGVSFFVAGYDSMTTTIVLLIHHLAQNPEIQEQVLAEVDAYFENHDDVDFGSLSELPLLIACLDETMRLGPPFRIAERICTKDFEYNGFRIKKGVVVQIPLWAHHRNPEYFKDPETFDPTRMLPENKSSLNAFTLSVFGHGPRNCAGIAMADTLLRASTAKIFKEFRFELCPETKIKYKPGRLFMVQYEPIDMKIIRRN